MSQNIYDDPGFFAGYSALPRQVRGLAAAPEWPMLRAMLPPMQDLRVLDLGCGFGWFCRWAREQGAARAHGVDLSENMLARARATTADPAITYERADLETVALADAAYDLAYSSLALHYVVALDALLLRVHDALVPGGRFVFSAEHPLYTAPHRPGWQEDAEGRRFWPIENYLNEGPRSTDWLAKGVIKQHRTFATWFGLLRDTGFRLAELVEWGPSEAELAADPSLASERDRPTFLLVAADRA